MVDVEHCCPLQPGCSLHLPAECRKIHQRQFKLNHALRPRWARRNVDALLPAPDSNQPIHGESSSRWSEDQEEPGNTQKCVAAVSDVKVSLLDRGKTKIDQHAVEAGQEANSQENCRT